MSFRMSFASLVATAFVAFAPTASATQYLAVVSESALSVDVTGPWATTLATTYDNYLKYYWQGYAYETSEGLEVASRKGYRVAWYTMEEDDEDQRGGSGTSPELCTELLENGTAIDAATIGSAKTSAYLESPSYGDGHVVCPRYIRVYGIGAAASPGDAGTASVSGQNCEGTFDAGSTVTLTATATKDGYSFTRWEDGSTENPRTLAATNDATYTAVFEVAVYTLNFDRGTYGAGENFSAEKTHNEDLTLPGATFTRDGYAQAGWSTSSDGTTKAYDLGGTYAANAGATLYPYWVVQLTTITYRPGNGISGQTYTDTKTHTQSVNLRGATYSKVGYTQDGWSTSEGGTKDYELSATYSETADLDLYPHWSANKYALKYELDGGTAGASHPSTTTYDMSVLLSAPTRQDYRFVGWKVSGHDDDTAMWGETSSCPNEVWPGEIETSGDIYVKNLTPKNKATVTLTAQWTQDEPPVVTHTVTFVDPSGTFPAEQQSVTHGEAATAPSWVTSKFESLAWDRSLENITEDVTIQAVWTCRVVFVDCAVTNRVQYQDAVTVPSPDPTSNGYTFVEWTPAVPEKALSNLTFAALWQPNPATTNEWAHALDCTNLVFTPDPGDCSIITNGTNVTAHCGNSCVSFEKTKKNVDVLTTQVPSSGILSFWWKGGSGTKFNISMTQSKSSKTLHATSDIDWTQVVITNNSASAQEITFSCTVVSGYCYLDCVEWGHPEPAQSDAIQSFADAGMTEEGFTFSFRGNPLYDYRVQTNADITAAQGWAAMDGARTNGAESVTFGPLYLPGEPRMFFKVETLRKQD